MPKSRNSNDQYSEDLLEGTEFFVADYRARVEDRDELDRIQRENRETSRWRTGIAIAVAIALTYTAQNWINYYSDLRSELSDVRERLAALEAFHSEQYFRPVHIHPTELRREPDQEMDSPAP